jgi:4-alpha-glucanotransferase
VTTHDLPTIAGLWNGSDLARARAAGVPQNEEGITRLRQKLVEMAHVATDATCPPVDDVIEEVYRALSAAPSRIVLATLEDALAVEERPNLPGAGPPWPNWAMGLPVPIDELERLGDRSLPVRVTSALRSHRSAAAS